MTSTHLKRWAFVAGRIVLILLTLLVALEFATTGEAKLTNSPQQITNFTHWGYPQWFMLVIGLLEASGALLLFGSLFVKRLALPGAMLIAADMCGAIYTHIAHGEWMNLPLPCTLLALVIVIGWQGRKSWLGALVQPKAAS